MTLELFSMVVAVIGTANSAGIIVDEGIMSVRLTEGIDIVWQNTNHDPWYVIFADDRRGSGATLAAAIIDAANDQTPFLKTDRALSAT